MADCKWIQMICWNKLSVYPTCAHAADASQVRLDVAICNGQCSLNELLQPVSFHVIVCKFQINRLDICPDRISQLGEPILDESLRITS
ncbi:hypothetical protein M514_13497 [Trichuris suis]|uniref:Uncharacterized protein n=1 Tax=Trichuris suis TaxID=68888 RepID=A0A085MVL2_9BILA|nr:hypothetical protein M514_13497 [Trichuris suis]